MFLLVNLMSHVTSESEYGTKGEPMSTPIAKRLGVEFPIFAFSHCRDVVAAVTNAGGFGVLGALAFGPEQLEIELNWIDEHVNGKPYGVDFAMPVNYVGKGGGEDASFESLDAMIPTQHREFVDDLLARYDVPELPPELEGGQVAAAGLNVDAMGPSQVEVCLNHPNVKMIVNALGPPPLYVIERAHEAGILVGGLAGSKVHAERQVAIGVDVIVAQGTEAGGHCGEISTMVLVPEVVDAVGPDIPVLAAGGIATGRQMAAAIALGAQGAWTGSMWLTVSEADTNPAALENMLAATSRDTVRSKAMTGKPARQLRTAWTDAWESEESPGTLPMPLQGILHQEAGRRTQRVGTRELIGFPVGQIVGRLNKVRPTKDVVREMVEEWIDTTERMASILSD
jgi:NAD(P)H-dependent flavin oxidoreductase YrpB (nitropropane dioxygenase family)